MTQSVQATQWPEAPGRRVAEAFEQFANWSIARKTLVLGLLVLFAHVTYLGVWEWVITPEDGLDALFIRSVLLLWIALIIVSLGIATLYLWLGSVSRAPLYFFFFSYGLMTVAFNYGFGLMDSVYASYGILGASMVALVDNWRAAAQMVGFWAAVTAAAAVTQAAEWVPYAPFFLDRSFEVRNSSGNIIMTYYWSLQGIAMVWACLWVMSTSRDYAQQTLEHGRNLIRSYLPPAVAERILAGKEAEVQTPQRRRVTVLFADIAGFTTMADRVEPEVVAQIVNEYLASMSELIEQHGGTLSEFAGDGFVALFGAPETLEPEEQVQRAIRAAAAIQRQMPVLNERWRKLGIGEPLNLRIGINTGILSVGSFGSKGRMTYTAIGLQTNIAARIQAQCPPGQVLISDSSWQLVRDQVECAPKGEIEMKGVHFPIKVYAAPLS